MFCSGLGRQERTGTGRLPETKNKDILTVISPDKPTDNLAMLHGGQDKTDHEQPTDNLAMLHDGQDKTDHEQPTGNLAMLHEGQDKTDHEQPTDNLAMLHGGQDKRETNMVSDTENILTVIPFDQTSRDQLMNDACQTRQKVDAGNISGTECLGNVCEHIHTPELPLGGSIR
ncbi:Hypothetical predicted protein [Mytilus galloprovincialis]|uniref:Uncharacterized protein n=1 Tax=Mytilus galloprovincialis TaxID=29158 RepID=A0A8B6HSV9_MYTGA|nr:Hypothetical predicted protein [Mytilus galloprovincialis]